MFWWPGRVRSGVLVDAPVENVDVVPTILDLLGIPRPMGIEGASLLPAFRGQIPRRPVYSQTQGFSVRRGRWKLWSRPGGSINLFDLVNDSLETNDLAAAFPDTLSSLEGDINRRLRRPPMPTSGAEQHDIDSETMRLLRQLGYVE